MNNPTEIIPTQDDRLVYPTIAAYKAACQIRQAQWEADTAEHLYTDEELLAEEAERRERMQSRY